MKPTIEQTYDYDKFKFFDYNRAISPAHVADLAESIKRDNRLSIVPILVDKEFNILDGQHRFIACKRLDIPVHYTIISGNVHDIIIDTNANHMCWDLKDFLNYYVKKGFPHYVKFQECMLRFNIRFNPLKQLMWSRKDSDSFRKGAFIFNEDILPFLEASKDFFDFCKQFLENDRKNIIKNQRLYGGLYNFYKQDKVKYQKLLKKLRDVVFEIPNFGSIVEYDKFFEKLYRNKVSKAKSTES